MSIKDNLEAFLRHMDKLEETDENNEDGYCKEYTRLRNLTMAYRAKGTIPATVGRLECNIRKNRYKDILPYDGTRVKLDEIEGVEGSDYINANFVKGASGHQSYIASQGPLPSTVNDFVRMMWQYSVRVVIMVCNEFENNKHKCQRYWPADDTETLTFGKVKVTMDSEVSHSGDFVERALILSAGEEKRVVQHFHFLAWPDHSTPASVTPILDVLACARGRQPQLDAPPMLVHCSAGCGRTGCIIVIDHVWNLLKMAKLKQPLNPYAEIRAFRQQRPSIVQSANQYIFVHHAIKELFIRHLRVIQQHLYVNVEVSNGGQEDPLDGEDSIYQEVGQAGGAIDLGNLALTCIYGNTMDESSSDPDATSPSHRVIAQTAERLADLEVNGPSPAEHSVYQNTNRIKSADNDKQAENAGPEKKEGPFYADPEPKPKKPMRPAKPPVYSNVDQPAVPPKTPESRTFVEDPHQTPVSSASPQKPASPHKPNISPKPDVGSKPPKPAVKGKPPSLKNRSLSHDESDKSRKGSFDSKHGSFDGSPKSPAAAVGESYEAISDWTSDVNKSRKPPPFNLKPVRKRREHIYEDVDNENKANEKREEYAYANPNNPNKWSLQHYALHRKSSGPSGSTSSSAEPTYSQVEPDYVMVPDSPADVLDDETYSKAVSFDSGEGSDEDDGSAGHSTASGNRSMTRNIGAIFKDRGKKVAKIPQAFNPSGLTKVKFKSKDICYPMRLGKPPPLRQLGCKQAARH